MKEQPKSRDCLKKFNGVEVFMCATTCAGLENCLIKRQRGEPVSDIISENYAPFKASVVDFRVSGEAKTPDEERCPSCHGTGLMNDERCIQCMIKTKMTKMPLEDELMEALAWKDFEIITLEKKIKELTCGSVPTPTEYEINKAIREHDETNGGRQTSFFRGIQWYQKWLRGSTERHLTDWEVQKIYHETKNSFLKRQKEQEKQNNG